MDCQNLTEVDMKLELLAISDTHLGDDYSLEGQGDRQDKCNSAIVERRAFSH